MQLKDILVTLAVPAICIAAAIPTPQDPVEPEFPDESTDDIVGGVAAVAGDVPFIVAVSLDGSPWCGGSLVNANTVVTAAHCIDGNSASSFTVRAGSLNRASGGTLVKVSRIIANPNYVESTTDADVAIFKLATPIAESSTIKYATLAASGNDPAAGSTATVAGWGSTGSGGSPTLLRKVDVPIVSRATCRNNYSTAAITTNMFCAGFAAGGKDSCQGDSGGPIITSSKTLIGIVSWGAGCAQPNKPGVYTRIGAVLPFINANL
ncbi:female reproductive tract protease-like protein [Plenodomus tracheiphilus IPT5]|uniref:Female reproductive tract protease-like protein n=1 Tax=Plenodomus tracheiphilus IPT5 TaxID=1408161 RepID=A0A6A7B8L9_9PLEO|nr:female reproductive tract protease-like protein [Plenodomus tracheiphilus IPT5]